MAPEVKFTRKIFPLYPVGIRQPPHKKIDNVTPKKPTFPPFYNSRDRKARKSCAGYSVPMIFQRLGVLGVCAKRPAQGRRVQHPKTVVPHRKGQGMREKKFYIAIASHFIYF
jgi:hypothetical protein